MPWRWFFPAVSSAFLHAAVGIIAFLFVVAVGFVLKVKWDIRRFERMTPEQRRELNRQREQMLGVERGLRSQREENEAQPPAVPSRSDVR